MTARIGSWTEITGLPDIDALAAAEVDGADYLPDAGPAEVAQAYREAVVDALPAGVEFDGDVFWGGGTAGEIRRAIDGIDRTAIAEECDRAARERAVESWREWAEGAA